MEDYFGFAKELLASGKAKQAEAYGEDNLYDITIPFTEDIDFYVNFCLKNKGTVLDIGCGTGRVMIPLLEAGINVVGMDASQYMLQECESKLEAHGLKGELFQGDMRSFTIERSFDVIIIPYYSMIYMLTDEDRLQTLQSVYQHLSTNGKLVFDFQAGSVEVGESLPWLGLQGIHPFTGDVLVNIVQMKGINPEVRLMNQINYRIGQDKTSITVQSSKEGVVSVDRMQDLLKSAGFKIKDFYQDYKFTPYKQGEECLVIAQK